MMSLKSQNLPVRQVLERERKGKPLEVVTKVVEAGRGAPKEKRSPCKVDLGVGKTLEQNVSFKVQIPDN